MLPAVPETSVGAMRDPKLHGDSFCVTPPFRNVIEEKIILGISHPATLVPGPKSAREGSQRLPAGLIPIRRSLTLV